MPFALITTCKWHGIESTKLAVTPEQISTMRLEGFFQIFTVKILFHELSLLADSIDFR